jgi:hypothetical protein
MEIIWNASPDSDPLIAVRAAGNPESHLASLIPGGIAGEVEAVFE